MLLRSGGVASVAYFQHATEGYALDLAAHVPSEGLLAGETATLIARPRLSVNGERVALDLLENAALVVTAVDQDGTSSTKVFDGFELEGMEEIVETILVPERLASLSVQLTATVRSISLGEDVSLASQARSVEINGAARTAHVAQAFLTRLPGAFAVDVRGRNGEPLADRRVRVTVRPAFIDESISQELKTDAAGRVQLGALVGVRSVEVSGPAGASGKWDLDPIGALGLAGELRGLAGVDLRLPFANGGGDALREDVSLLETRGGTPLRDRFDALALEGGYLVLRGLTAGEYALTLKDTEQSYGVRVVDGVARMRLHERVDGVAKVQAALGPGPASCSILPGEGHDVLHGLRDHVVVGLTQSIKQSRHFASGLGISNRKIACKTLRVETAKNLEDGICPDCHRRV